MMVDPTDLSTLQSQVQNLESKVDNFNNATAVLGVITAFIAVLSLYYNKKLNTTKNQYDAVKDRIAVISKRESDEKIAIANAKAKSAEEGTAKANERAEVAVSTAAQARVEQQTLSIESRKVQKELADAQRKQAEAELALANKVEEIRIKQLPRVLTSKQQQRLTELLSKAPKGKVGVEIKSTDDETYVYGNQITKCFKDAGWSISDSTVLHVMATGGGTDGIIITVNNVKNQPPARATALAFRELGIKFKVEIDTLFSADYFEIFIGGKPQ